MSLACRFKSCYPHHRCEGICFGQVPFFTARHTACPQDLNLPYNRAAGEACAAGAGFKSCYPHHKCEGICFGQVPFLLRGTVCRNTNTSLTHMAGDSFRFLCAAPQKSRPGASLSASFSPARRFDAAFPPVSRPYGQSAAVWQRISLIPPQRSDNIISVADAEKIRFFPAPHPVEEDIQLCQACIKP